MYTMRQVTKFQEFIRTSLGTVNSCSRMGLFFNARSTTSSENWGRGSEEDGEDLGIELLADVEGGSVDGLCSELLAPNMGPRLRIWGATRPSRLDGGLERMRRREVGLAAGVDAQVEGVVGHWISLISGHSSGRREPAAVWRRRRFWWRGGDVGQSGVPASSRQ